MTGKPKAPIVPPTALAATTPERARTRKRAKATCLANTVVCCCTALLPVVTANFGAAQERAHTPVSRDQRDNAAGVHFNFHGASWKDVLTWLADESKLNFDWQEVPEGELQLVTQKRYSLAEARDILNMHLLARGYTLLLDGEMLTVCAIDKIDRGRVPRVAPDQLHQHLPHEFVRTTFKLDWLLASEAANELRPLLSKNGVLTPMLATNRLEAMDTVGNLQHAYETLRAEGANGEQNRLVREFVLQHTPASEVLTQLQKILGIGSKKTMLPPPGTVAPEVFHLLETQSQQQSPDDWVSDSTSPSDSEGTPGAAASGGRAMSVAIVHNPRRNGLLVHATPDKLAIVAEAIKTLDVPHDQFGSALENAGRTKIYHLHHLKADAVIATLLESATLEPGSRLRSTNEGRALIVTAALADHLIIGKLLESLDHTGRRFEVLRLRRLTADEVAGTISAMMGAERDARQTAVPDPSAIYQNGYPTNPAAYLAKEESQDHFRVEADVAGNRLLCWASEFELREVQVLLEKLGESGRQDENYIRVLDIDPARQLEALELLRRHWPSGNANPLELPAAPNSPQAAPRPAPDASDKTATRHMLIEHSKAHVATGPIPQHADQTTAEAEPPVKVTVAPDGSWIISSQDTQALNRLESLLGRYLQLKSDYRIFELRHASAAWFAGVLKQFFQEDQERLRNGLPTQNPSPGGEVASLPISSQSVGSTARLSERRSLRFIAAANANSVLVRGASADQLQVISRLVEYYDRMPAADSSSIRTTEVYPLRYSRAAEVAATLREVFRDALNPQQAQGTTTPEHQELVNVSHPSTPSTSQATGKSSVHHSAVGFQSPLAIAIDPVSNALVISANGQELLQSVRTVIATLDRRASDADVVQVMSIPPRTTASQVRQALENLRKQGAIQFSDSSQPQDERKNESPAVESRSAAPLAQ